MTELELTELKELHLAYERMIHGRKSWDQKIYDEYVKLLIYHSSELIKNAEGFIKP